MLQEEATLVHIIMWEIGKRLQNMETYIFEAVSYQSQTQVHCIWQLKKQKEQN